MATYTISSAASVEMGQYEGRTETEALVALHHEAGYPGVKYDADSDAIVWPDAETEQLCGGLDAWTISQA